MLNILFLLFFIFLFAGFIGLLVLTSCTILSKPFPSLKQHRSRATIAVMTVLLYLIFWKIATIDPEGACYNPKYFDKCFYGWVEYRDLFGSLPTDEKLTDIFHENRKEFDKLMQGFLPQQSLYAGRDAPVDSLLYKTFPYIFIKDFASQSHSTAGAFYFAVDYTLYIRGADELLWPHVVLDKGYVYFRTPPLIKDGYAHMETGHDFNFRPKRWRVLGQLDRRPDNWGERQYKVIKGSETALRQLNAHWFIYLSTEHIGG